MTWHFCVSLDMSLLEPRASSPCLEVDTDQLGRKLPFGSTKAEQTKNSERITHSK